MTPLMPTRWHRQTKLVSISIIKGKTKHGSYLFPCQFTVRMIKPNHLQNVLNVSAPMFSIPWISCWLILNTQGQYNKDTVA